MIKDIIFEKGEHKYLQLYSHLKNKILNGTLKYNEKMPTIRHMAQVLNVNSVTVVKAYGLLEKEGYITKKVGSGCYVSVDIEHNHNTNKIKKDGSYRLDNANPSLDIFPIEDFKKAINRAMEKEGANIFSYDEEYGISELKDEMIVYLCENGIKSKPENIVIISGAQQGIDIVSKALINYSDIVYVEEPSYPGALDILKSRGAKIVSIPMLRDGIDIGILKMKLEKTRPKLIYVMPNFQNPTGISYSENKKKKLLELAEQYDFYILEDDFISDFKFMEEESKTLKSYDTNNRVIYIKSFSKILMPGLRVGVMSIPSELKKRIILSKNNSDISTSTLIQKSLYYYMSQFNWKHHISFVEKIYTQRYQECRDYIYKKLGDKFKIVDNKGGINFFIGLKRGYFSRDFCEYMHKKNVILLSGDMFNDNKIDDRYFRLNIATEEVERIKEAVDIIADSVDNFYEEMDERK